MAKMCHQKGEQQSMRYVEVSSNENTSDEQFGLGLHTLTSKGQSGPGQLLEGKRISMEVDTGSAVSIVSEVEYNRFF